MSMVKGKVHFDREPTVEAIEFRHGAARVVKVGNSWVDAKNPKRKAALISLDSLLGSRAKAEEQEAVTP